MKIRIYEPARREEGFFHVVYQSLLRCKGARFTPDPRPLPLVMSPRQHTSAWMTFDGHPVLFDMNDHVFFYDLAALERCEVYFKANLNWEVTDKVLQAAGLTSLRHKIQPFFFFSPNPARDRAWRRINWFRHRNRPRYDVCHVVGVYRNDLMTGTPTPFAPGVQAPLDPAAYHFWIRYHTQDALRAAGISGYYRLTSRGNHAIEDHRTVFPNLTAWPYSKRLIDGRLTMVNTLPHAVLPWKAAESLAMGRPLIFERAPLAEMPEPFGLKKDVHYLELFPEVGGFDAAATIDHPASYRVLNPVDPRHFTARAEWLREVLADRSRIEGLTEKAREYASTVLVEGVVADFICDRVAPLIH